MKIKVYEIVINEDVPSTVWYASKKGQKIDTVLSAKHFNEHGSQNFDKCRFYPMTERIYWLSKGTNTNFTNAINQHDLIKDTAEGTDKEHKRAFPVKLAQRFIICFPDAELIFDPYMGSGTTTIAAIRESI